jgi:hypothetical protein
MFSKKIFFLVVFAISLSACQKEKQECTLEPETGSCNAAFIRYYFNNSTKKCETFIWGGCNDGVVPFETKEECEMCGCK